MAIDVHCDLCSREIKIRSALVFGPPRSDLTVLKLHVCCPCWEEKILPLVCVEVLPDGE